MGRGYKAQGFNRKVREAEKSPSYFVDILRCPKCPDPPFLFFISHLLASPTPRLQYLLLFTLDRTHILSILL